MHLLFKPFSTAGEASKEDGRGIGLVLTKALVEALHGKIGVHSEPSVMTQFWIELPRKFDESEIPDRTLLVSGLD